MNFSNKLPATFLIAALTLSGAAVATAQAADTDAATPSPAAERSFGKHGHGMRGGFTMGQLQDIDTDGDGAITQAEIDAYRAAKVGEADASGDGNLSLEEWATIFDTAQSDRRVDSFQRLDADGDGQITPDELDEIIAHIVARMDRNDDGQIDGDDRPRRGEGRGERRGPRGGN